jgi:hypothetical protein
MQGSYLLGTAGRGLCMNTDDHGFSLLQSDQLSELDGATFEWEVFTVSHGMLFLKVSIERKHQLRSAILGFNAVSYVDCPTTMHDAVIRIANNIENERVQSNLPTSFAVSLTKESKLFAFSCNEGGFFILALDAWLSWDEEVYKEHIESIKSESLWVNGPTINNL